MYKNYIDRLKVSLKRNGLFKTFLRFPNKSAVILRDLSQRKRNKIIYDIVAKHTTILPWTYSFLGGYTLKDQSKIDKDSKVALCFGIYDDVNLELSLSKLGYKVYAFDPTPISQDLFKNNPDLGKHIYYTPCAVWSEDKKMKFFYKEEDQNFDNFEGTLEDIDHSDNYELVDAFSLKSIIHNHHIDNVAYLKMDIEGAVPEVLIAYFSSEFDADKFPYEIVFELEMPKEISSLKSKELLKNIDTLFDKLNQHYNVYSVPSDGSRHNLHIHCTRIDKEG